MSGVTARAAIDLRRAEPKDRDELVGLAADFATSFVVAGSAFDRSLAEVLAHDDSALFVATVSGDVVGYICASVHPTLYATGPVAWIEELMVRDTAWRAGVGRALVRAVEGWAAQRAVGTIALATRRAEAFWHAVGYEDSATYLRKLLDTSPPTSGI